MSEQLVEVLESIYDQEIELDIYNLVLVYEINIDEVGFCKVIMNFTDSGCSCADTMPGELFTALKTIDVIEDPKVE
ncbi:iron-sulfur cluster assembly protein, partial [Streptococcus suis]